MARYTVGSTIALAFVVALGGCAEPGHVEQEFPALGTLVVIELHTTDQATAEMVFGEMRTAIERVDRTMSNWDEASLLNRINAEARSRPRVIDDPDTYRCIKLARVFAQRSGGAFDPTVGPLMRLYGLRPFAPRIPSDGEIEQTMRHVGWERFEVLAEARAVRFLDDHVELDLGGIVRGCALDVAARNFARVGIRGGRLGIEGTVLLWGELPDGSDWRVPIADPTGPGEIAAHMTVRNRSVSSSTNSGSGFTRDGVEYGHILDPKTGRPAASDVVSATVTADSAMEADALSTAFLVAGSQRTASLLTGARRLEVVLEIRTAEGPMVLASTTLKGKIEFTEAYRGKVRDRIRFILPSQM